MKAIPASNARAFSSTVLLLSAASILISGWYMYQQIGGMEAVAASRSNKGHASRHRQQRSHDNYHIRRHTDSNAALTCDDIPVTREGARASDAFAFTTLEIMPGEVLTGYKGVVLPRNTANKRGFKQFLKRLAADNARKYSGNRNSNDSNTIVDNDSGPFDVPAEDEVFLPRISLHSFFSICALRRFPDDDPSLHQAVVYYDPEDWARLGLLAPSFAAHTRVLVGLHRHRAAVLPAGLSYVAIQLDSMGPQLRPHSSGRHVAERGAYLLSAWLICNSVIGRPIKQRVHAGGPSVDEDGEDTPVLYDMPQECGSLTHSSAHSLQWALYVRPGAAVRFSALTVAAEGTSSSLLPAPQAILHGWHICGDLLNEHYQPTLLSDILPFDVAAKLEVDLNTTATVDAVGAVLVHLPTVGTSWDALAFAKIYGCLLDEHCIHPRGSLHAHPHLRGDAALVAALGHARALWEGQQMWNMTKQIWTTVVHDDARLHQHFHLSSTTLYDNSPTAHCVSIEGTAALIGCTEVAGAIAAELWSAFSPAFMPPDSSSCEVDSSDAKLMHRRWYPTWSGMSEVELYLLGVPASPPGWGTRDRIVVAHVVMGPDTPSTSRIVQHLSRSPLSVDLIIGCWRTVCEQPPGAGIAISILGSTWSTGRNMLLQRARLQEVLNGYLYELLAFWDDDVRLLGFCNEEASDVAFLRDHEKSERDYDNPPAGDESLCHSQMDSWVAKALPPVAIPAISSAPQLFCMSTNRPYSYVYWHDPMAVYLHRRAVDALLPYDTYMDRRSWWASQGIFLAKASMFLGDVLQFNNIQVHNTDHRDYPRGDHLPGHPCWWPLPYMLRNAKLPEAQLSQMHPGCKACELAQVPSHAKEQFGTLQWLHTAGRPRQRIPAVREAE